MVLEEVVHTRNVIAFFVWAWPSGFCDWSCFPWWATSWRGTVWSYRRQKGGSTPRTLIPVWTLPLRHLSRVVWAWPMGLNGDGKNVQTLWWAELDRLHSMTRAHPPLLMLGMFVWKEIRPHQLNFLFLITHRACTSMRARGTQTQH